MTTTEHREKLARVIDETAWKHHDAVVDNYPKASKELIKDSLEMADRIIESGLMASETWDRKEYLNARKNIIDATSRRGYCYDVQDLLDGYFMHDPRCPYWPAGASGGSGCIKS